MRIENIQTSLFLVADCPRPIWNEEICSAIADEGIDSILVVGDDRTPWPSAQGSLWCYSRPFRDPDAPSKRELQRISDFVLYEADHGRTVGIWIEHNNARDVILVATKGLPPTKVVRSYVRWET